MYLIYKWLKDTIICSLCQLFTRDRSPFHTGTGRLLKLCCCFLFCTRAAEVQWKWGGCEYLSFYHAFDLACGCLCCYVATQNRTGNNSDLFQCEMGPPTTLNLLAS